MFRRSKIAIAAALAVALVSGPAFAYVGPGAGLSLMAAFWALLTAVVASLAFLVLWPLRRRRQRLKAARAGNAGHESGLDDGKSARDRADRPVA